jgi:hypothetical protein
MCCLNDRSIPFLFMPSLAIPNLHNLSDGLVGFFLENFSFLGIFAFTVFLLLQVILVSNYYKSVILSFLFKPPDLNPFHNSAEMTNLIANGDYKMITTRVNYFGNWYG